MMLSPIVPQQPPPPPSGGLSSFATFGKPQRSYGGSEALRYAASGGSTALQQQLRASPRTHSSVPASQTDWLSASPAVSRHYQRQHQLVPFNRGAHQQKTAMLFDAGGHTSRSVGGAVWLASAPFGHRDALGSPGRSYPRSTVPPPLNFQPSAFSGGSHQNFLPKGSRPLQLLDSPAANPPHSSRFAYDKNKGSLSQKHLQSCRHRFDRGGGSKDRREESARRQALMLRGGGRSFADVYRGGANESSSSSTSLSSGTDTSTSPSFSDGLGSSTTASGSADASVRRRVDGRPRDCRQGGSSSRTSRALEKRSRVDEDEASWKAKLGRVFESWGGIMRKEEPEKRGSETTKVRRTGESRDPPWKSSTAPVDSAATARKWRGGQEILRSNHLKGNSEMGGRGGQVDDKGPAGRTSMFTFPDNEIWRDEETRIGEEQDIEKLKLLKDKLKRIQQEIQVREGRLSSAWNDDDKRSGSRHRQSECPLNVESSDRSFITFLRQLAKTSPLQPRQEPRSGTPSGSRSRSSSARGSQRSRGHSLHQQGVVASWDMGGLQFGAQARVFGVKQTQQRESVILPPANISRSGTTRKHSIYLRVYDISEGMARVWSKFVLFNKVEGIWHSGISAYGYEYFYSDGILRMRPKDVENTYAMNLRQVHYVGETEQTKEDFERFLDSLAPLFCESTYDILEWNCNDFTNICALWVMGHLTPPSARSLPYSRRPSLCERLPRHIQVSQWDATTNRDKRMNQIWRAMGHRSGCSASSMRPAVLPAYVLNQPAAFVKEPVGRLIISCMRMAQGNLGGVDEMFGRSTFTDACKDAMTRMKDSMDAAVHAVQAESARTAQKVKTAKWCC